MGGFEGTVGWWRSGCREATLPLARHRPPHCEGSFERQRVRRARKTFYRKGVREDQGPGSCAGAGVDAPSGAVAEARTGRDFNLGRQVLARSTAPLLWERSGGCELYWRPEPSQSISRPG